MKNLLVILTLFSTMVGTVNGEPEKEAGKPAANWEYKTDDGMFHPERSEGGSNDDPYYKPSLSESAKPSTDDNVKYELPVMSKSEQNAYYQTERDAERLSRMAEASARQIRDSYGNGIRSSQEREEQLAIEQKQAQAQAQKRAIRQALAQQAQDRNEARARQQVQARDNQQTYQPQEQVQQQGAFDPRTGEYFAPTGDGGYVGTKNGHVMAPAGPGQMIDTKTGKSIQTY